MVDYPFDENVAFIDRQSFEALARHFTLADIPEDDDFVTKYKKFGHGCFIYDHEKLCSLDTPTLVALSPFLFTNLEYAFAPNANSKPASNTQILQLLQDRGITRQQYIDNLIDFEFASLGDESAQIIVTIAEALAPNPDYYLTSELNHLHLEFNCFRERYQKHKLLLDKYNQDKRKPFTLEHVLDFDNEPVALRYSSSGNLYVLDNESHLHEFDGKKETRQWELSSGPRHDWDGINFGGDLGGLTVLPNIAVENEFLFLTIGNGEVERHDLTKQRALPKTIALALRGQEEDVMRRYRRGIICHDVLIKDGNVLVSASEGEAVRYILQATPEGMNIVYRGRYPVNHMRNTLEDHTLRLGLHQGNLYFPRGRGISLFAGDKPREILGEYVNEEHPYGTKDPITKFSFGRDFMICCALLQGFELPMLTFFKPVYKNSEQALAPVPNVEPPSRFQLEYISYLQKMTGITMHNTSLSAHEDRFAVTHSMLGKVFIYKVNSEANESHERR